MRRALVAAAVIVSLVALATEAGAIEAEPEPPEVTASLNKGPAGSIIEVQGTCSERGSGFVSLYFHPLEPNDRWSASGEAEMDAEGRFTGSIIVPTAAPAGSYILDVDCAVGDVGYAVRSLPFLVTAAPASPQIEAHFTRTPEAVVSGEQIVVTGVCRDGDRPAQAAAATMRSTDPANPLSRSQRWPVGEDAAFAGLLSVGPALEGGYVVGITCLANGRAYGYTELPVVVLAPRAPVVVPRPNVPAVPAAPRVLPALAVVAQPNFVD